MDAEILDLLHKNPLEPRFLSDVGTAKKIRGGYLAVSILRSNDSTASLWLRTASTFAGGFWEDLGTGLNGNHIHWLMATRGMTRRDAIAFLRGDDKPIPSATRITHVIEGDSKEYKRPSMELVKAYHAHVGLAMPYYESRGISREVANVVKLGYIPNKPFHVSIKLDTGKEQWLGRPFIEIPVYTIPNIIGNDGGDQLVRAIHIRYDTDTARQKLTDMWRLNDRNAQALHHYLITSKRKPVDDDPVNVIFNHLFGSRYSNVYGSEQALFNGNVLLANEKNVITVVNGKATVNPGAFAPVPYAIVGEGPLPAYVAMSEGYRFSVGLPHNETNIKPDEAFRHVTGKIFCVTDDDDAGEKRYQWLKKACGDKVVRINPGKRQLDGMIQDGTLQPILHKWGVDPDKNLATATPWD